MRFGVNLLNFGSGTTPRTLERQATDARALGFTFAMISDHIAVTPDVHEVYPAPFYDQFVLAAHLAGRVPGLRLGTTITVIPYRHPLQTARLAANIDQLNDAGFILGAGVGWSAAEYRALGVPFEERGAITDEYLAAIRAAWAQDPCDPRRLGAGPVHLRGALRLVRGHPYGPRPRCRAAAGLGRRRLARRAAQGRAPGRGMAPLHADPSGPAREAAGRGRRGREGRAARAGARAAAADRARGAARHRGPPARPRQRRPGPRRPARVGRTRRHTRAVRHLPGRPGRARHGRRGPPRPGGPRGAGRRSGHGRRALTPGTMSSPTTP
ncbi:LLM class flavin-dependent oxidoreductase [Streptomyces sp. NBC_00009]|uniref:LLM class flavin-dependent oxidoreductase n=1 Tax=Streptomyces sp. NBC_00009 TaxID=2975620 RepID=UPI00386E7102